MLPVLKWLFGEGQSSVPERDDCTIPAFDFGHLRIFASSYKPLAIRMGKEIQ